MKSKALLEEASRLEVAERIELVEAIWETLGVDPEALPVSPPHRDELDGRLLDLEANPEAGSSWSEVRERLGLRGR
ncbi:MAG: addiction module protein [Thermoanaerobaculia bacterium]